MGFFNSFKRLISGQPPFEAAYQASQQQMQHNNMQQSPDDQAYHGHKVIPEVEIERVATTMNGQQMQVTCFIQNNSRGNIQLDKIHLLGTSLSINSVLRPGQQDPYNVYNGNRPRSMNDRTVELYYKDESGDYFCANHNIEYQREPDNTYIITEMRLMRPIRDV